MANSNRICSVPGCGKLHEARGYCNSHYANFRRIGTPVSPRNYRATKPWIEAHLSYSATACLIWPFARSEAGYAIMGADTYRSEHAHRYICERAHGLAPTPKYEVAHSCGNGHLGCVNPRHLRWATHKENMADKKLHGRTSRGSQVCSSKLSETDVLEIRRLAPAMSVPAIAAQYAVSKVTIYCILRRKTWAWL